MRRKRGRSPASAVGFGLGLLLAVAGPGGAETPIEELPGFVDFAGLQQAFSDESLTIEVNLEGPLLRLLSESLRTEDTDFADLISRLELIRVRIYEPEEVPIPEIVARLHGLAGELGERRWETVVRVREDGDHILILVRNTGDRLAGLVAMFVDDESAGFINIVGDFDPAQLGRLGRRLQIDPLAVLDKAAEAGPGDDGRGQDAGGEQPATSGGDS